MDNLLIGALVLLFVAVFIAAESGLAWWNSTKGPEARRIDRRLRAMSAGGHVDSATASLLKERLLSNSPGFQRLLMQLPRVGSLDRLLVQSGTEMTVSIFLGWTAILFAVGFFGSLLFRMPVPIAVVIGAVLAALPLQYALYRRSTRLKRFETLLPEGLDLIGRALRAGHSFSSSLQMAGEELPEPIGEEMRQTFDEINFGVPVNTALENLVARVPSTDLGFFAIAVMIQRETGGNLAEVLDNISGIIRERLKLYGKVRTLSAEGRLSAVILAALPFLTGFLLFTINPVMMSTLWTDPTGRKMSITGIVMIVIGFLWMRKIVRLRV